MNLDRLPQKSCVGTGFLTIDIIVQGNTKTPQYISAGGTCANVLSILALLGWDCLPIARIGNDAAAKILLSDLKTAGVRTEGIHLATGIATPILIHRYGLGTSESPKHRFEWQCPVCGSHFPKFRPTPISLLHEGLSAERPTLFYFDRATPGSLKMAREAKKQGAIIVFEPPKVRDEVYFDGAVSIADIVKIASPQSLQAIEQRYAPVPLLIETLAEQGLRYKMSGFLGMHSDWTSKPAYSVHKIVDTCGSGDWLSAGFLHALFGVQGGVIDQNMVDDALAFGQSLSALNCEHAGARGLMWSYHREEIVDMAAMLMAEGDLAQRGEPSFCRISRMEQICTICPANKYL